MLPVAIHISACMNVVQLKCGFGQLLDDGLVVVLEDDMFCVEFVGGYCQQSMPATDLGDSFVCDDLFIVLKLEHLFDHLDFTLPQLKPAFVDAGNDVVGILLVEDDWVFVV